MAARNHRFSVVAHSNSTYSILMPIESCLLRHRQEVPNFDRFILATNNDAFSIPNQADRKDRILYSILLNPGSKCTFLDIPNSYRPVEGSGGKVLAITGEAHRADRLDMSDQDLFDATSQSVPKSH
jgi:hypothetical protein